MTFTPISTLWILICAALVGLMQAGFLGLEAGFTRSKNNINVAVKNVADFGVSAFGFWFLGYTIMFRPLNEMLTPYELGANEMIFLFFQLMFCGTAVTIISGGAAERLRFRGYIMVAAITTLVIYPIFGRWAWAGLFEGELIGWLGGLGFYDFAGSAVVHMIGGASCLALIMIIGPRTGRFTVDGQTNKIIGSNLPFAALGVMVLWIGWFGFNGGSLLAFNGDVPFVLINTALAGTTGLVASGIASIVYYRKVLPETFLNGPLAGLVAVTAAANIVTPTESLIIGFIGGLVAFGAELLLVHWRIDDAVGAVPVHFAGGAWGVLAVALFGDPVLIGSGLPWLGQIGIQLLGIVVAFVWAFGVSYFSFSLLSQFFGLRVSLEAESIGLNVYEHDARTDLVDLFLVMDEQATTGNLSLRAPVEPFTEVGQVAQKYNIVMGRLEESVARMGAIVNTAQEGILTFSPQTWLIESANPAAEHILQLGEDALTHHRLTDFIQQQFDSADMMLATTRNRFVEVPGRRSNGEPFPMEMSVSEIRAENTLFYTMMFRDITRRKRTMVDLATARDEALQAARLKDQLLAMVGHELRTPIMAISGSAELLENGTLGDVNDSQKEFLTQIIDSSIHLNMMVNDLIEQAHLESGRVNLNLHTFEVRPFVEQMSYPLMRLAEEKGLPLNVSVDQTMPFDLFNDSTRIKQVVTNLVMNGIKYTEEGSVTVVFSADSVRDWQVTVTDTGIGIPQEKQAEIFEPFLQAEDVKTRSYGGVGLGLAIVDQLVSLMQGKVKLESVVGEGTTATVTIPHHQARQDRLS